MGSLYSVDWTTGLDYWTGIATRLAFDPKNRAVAIYSLDWTTGLDHWTGLLDWNTGLTFDPKIAHKRLHLAPYSLVGRVGL